PRSNLAMLDYATGLATSWDPEADGAVWSLAVAGNTLFCGGDFATIAGAPRSRIASLALGSGVADAWNPGADATVRALAFEQGILFAGGDFTAIGGQPRTSLAALNPASASVLPLDGGIGPGHTVHAITRAAGRTFAAGSQTTASAEPTVGLTAVVGPDPVLGVGGPAPGSGLTALRIEPRPARTVANVRLQLPRDTDVEIGLYDLAGRRVAVLAPKRQRAAGEVSTSFETRRLSPGIYLVRARTTEGEIGGKLVVVP